jgi:manganese-dependent ADP-ribose/CDP-alcohol diphosphatase
MCAAAHVPIDARRRRGCQVASCPAGVVADIQYADIPDGQSYHGVPRYYRNSLAVLQQAVDEWRAAAVGSCITFGEPGDPQPLHSVVFIRLRAPGDSLVPHLRCDLASCCAGDILDGFQPREGSEAALSRVLAVLDAGGLLHRHMLGNHCLYNLPRERLNERLGITGGRLGMAGWQQGGG